MYNLKALLKRGAFAFASNSTDKFENLLNIISD